MQKTLTDLPKPNANALALSKLLTEEIHKRIHEQGSMTFSEYFSMCLYWPNLGYYENDLLKFGEHGDFVTAPELSPFFSYALANQAAEILEEINNPIILELGAGSGKMAADLLTHLKKNQTLPDEYHILERSLNLKKRQQAYLQTQHPDYYPNIKWINAPPEESWQGLLLANEVIDALPVDRFIIQEGQPLSLNVGLTDNELSYIKADASSSLKEKIHTLQKNHIYFQNGYVSEYCPSLSPWLKALSEHLQKGACLFIDYGYPQKEYYQPLRNTGNILAHFRHHAHEDFFLYPGLQDLTANVDFTALADAALENGLKLSGYTSQMYFLFGCQLENLLQEAHAKCNETQWFQIAQKIQPLVLPSEMGERFQAMLLTKHLQREHFMGFQLPSKQL